MAHLKKCRWQSDNNEALKTAFEAFRNRRKTAKNVAKKITKNKVGFLAYKRKMMTQSRSKTWTSQDRHNAFKKATLYGPIFACCCCHRMLFRNWVVEFSDKVKAEIKKKNPKILDTCVYGGKTRTIKDKLLTDIGKGKQAWLCRTCMGKMMKGQMPPMCHNNNLQIKEETDLDPLTELEASLISPMIPFMKIMQLPNSRFTAMTGKVAYVPINPSDTEMILSDLDRIRTPKVCLLISQTNYI